MEKSKKTIVLNIIIAASRYFAGIVFLFSGFVKAVDPWGSTYKFIDYFHDAFHITSVDFLALPMAFILSALEFIVGVGLLVNSLTRVWLFLALLFMVVFTPLTLYLAISDPVHDCGCFGDALILSNWETFWKNIVISIAVVLPFLYRKQISETFTKKIGIVIITTFTIGIFGFQYWNFSNLPVIDFRPYKIGNYLPSQMVAPPDAETDVYEQYFTLEDTTTGKKIEIESKVYTQDSTYWGQNTKYKYITQTEPKLIKKGYVPPIHDLSVTDSLGVNHLDSVFNNEDYVLWLIAYNVKKASIEGLKKGNEIGAFCRSKNIKFYFLTSSNGDDLQWLKKEIPQWNCDPYTTDGITLKTIVRSHPGLVLLKKGVVINKWHHTDFPNTNELNAMIQKK